MHAAARGIASASPQRAVDGGARMDMCPPDPDPATTDPWVRGSGSASERARGSMAVDTKLRWRRSSEVSTRLCGKGKHGPNLRKGKHEEGRRRIGEEEDGGGLRERVRLHACPWERERVRSHKLGAPTPWALLAPALC
jgi:hypothetical protein